MLFEKRLMAVSISVALLASGCNREQPRDPNVIETKLADGRVLHYTRQELDEAQSWGYTKAKYESALSMGQTHGALIEYSKQLYWHKDHPGTPPPGITPPPAMRAN